MTAVAPQRFDRLHGSANSPPRSWLNISGGLLKSFKVAYFKNKKSFKLSRFRTERDVERPAAGLWQQVSIHSSWCCENRMAQHAVFPAANALTVTWEEQYTQPSLASMKTVRRRLV